MSRPLEVLLIEDREDDAILITRALSRAGFEPHVQRVETEPAMRDALAGPRKWDIILSDYMLPRFSCESALRVLKESEDDIPFIALSGTVSEETILTLVRAGAVDYVMKDNLARLPSAIEREMKEAEGRQQRKRLEAQLQHAMKMEAIGRLAGGVAHDFNNLLTVISGFAQLALMEDNPAREGLEQILLAADRAAGLTRQLLAFSRQQELALRVFDINRLVREMEKMLRRLIGEDVQVITRLDSEPLNVKADYGQLEQVVLNLAVNARDAMPGGGKLILSTSRRVLEGPMAAIHGLPEGEYCVVVVGDTGEGIAPDVLPHIFEPFFTTKPEGQGTGLGLSTVYGIVKQCGGAIHAYSEKGTGTTMSVFLPPGDAVATPEKLVDRDLLPSGTETVLVIEDSIGVLELVYETLGARGFKVLKAQNADAALACLRELRATGLDLLITDVVLPGMAGPRLAGMAAELIPGLKVLFMSGYTEDVIQNHGLSAQHADFIQKPFSPSALLQKVRKLLDLEAPARN